jgi:hypothetical protein
VDKLHAQIAQCFFDIRGVRENMGSETEGGRLDIHFGSKTDVDICHYSLEKKNTSDHCKKTVWSYPADYLLAYDRLHEHHTYGSNGVYHLYNLWLKKRPGRLHTDCTAPTILKNQTGTFCYFQDSNGRFPSFTGSF